jgi:hypothetical protein
MDGPTQVRLTGEVMDEILDTPDFNFLTTPTRAIERVIRLALIKGWDAAWDAAMTPSPKKEMKTREARSLDVPGPHQHEEGTGMTRYLITIPDEEAAELDNLIANKVPIFLGPVEDYFQAVKSISKFKDFIKVKPINKYEVADPTADGPYAATLRERLRDATDRTERYRLTAELEDLVDGRWTGERTDDPPMEWEW